MSVRELVGLLDTMTPPERQAATTEIEPLRQQELNSMPEYIDPVPLAMGSSDIRSEPVQANTVSRRTAHMPMSMRAPARPGNAIVPSEAPPASVYLELQAPKTPQPPKTPKTSEPQELEVGVDQTEAIEWGADYLLLFACMSWSVIASGTMFVLALL